MTAGDDTRGLPARSRLAVFLAEIAGKGNSIQSHIVDERIPVAVVVDAVIAVLIDHGIINSGTGKIIDIVIVDP